LANLRCGTQLNSIDAFHQSNGVTYMKNGEPCTFFIYYIAWIWKCKVENFIIDTSITSLIVVVS
jgi:hypothetical protein